MKKNYFFLSLVLSVLMISSCNEKVYEINLRLAELKAIKQD